MKRMLPVVLVLCALPLRARAAPADAAAVVREAGVRGGLVVHAGCDAPAFTAGLCVDDRFLVHALDRDPARVATARDAVRSLAEGRRVGKVSVAHWTEDGLPYADNLVNLLVVSDPGVTVPDGEILRVLVPGGVALLRGDSKAGSPAASLKGWAKIVKPRPAAMGEWTHGLHGPDGNAVGRDRIVGPPRSLQWMAAPLWARLHDAPSTTSAHVSAGGRVFYIGDEGPAGMYQDLADKWFLVARDAFNGTLLWKRPMPEWGWKQWVANWHARNNQPFQLSKRLVAVDDAVYVTLGFNAPLSALDAATGGTVKTYEGTQHTDEILFLDGLLILGLNETPHRPAAANQEPLKKSVAVVEAETGRILWKKSGLLGMHAKTDSIRPVGRLELAAADGRVHLVDRDAIVALDLKTGDALWRVPRPKADEYKANFNTLMSELSVLVVGAGVVLFAQPEGGKSFHSVPGTLYAFDAKDGKALWKRRYGGWVHNTPPNVFVIDGMLWIHEHLDVALQGKSPKNQAGLAYAVLGLDPRTGEEQKRHATRDILNVGHHHRCYRNKATDRFLLMSRRGVEFVDLETGRNHLHHWTRGDCQMGVMPCNGLLYTTPHPCGCYLDTKLNGYFALAGERFRMPRAGDKPSERLVKGPAFGRPPAAPLAAEASDWPAFRADAKRSGSIPGAVPSSLQRRWEADLGGRVGPVSVAGGKVFVPVVDAHRVAALDAETGKPVWDFTADGRVDTPPTLYRGLALFGAADGWVYAVRTDSGELAWKRRLAPRDWLIGCRNQLESAWPVHGAVLVQGERLYAAAGRSTYLDGGIHLYVMQPDTGEILDRRTRCTSDPESVKKQSASAFDIPGLLADILVGDGSSVYMRRDTVFGDESASKAHVFATGGLRDDSWFNRTTWQVGGMKHAQLLVFNERSAYGLAAYAGTSRARAFEPGAKGYRLFATVLQAPRAKKPAERGKRKKGKDGTGAGAWSIHVPVRGTAMALAGDTLFVAGAPDTVDPDDPLGALEGRKGMVLCAFAAADGKPVAELKLDSLPVWDGLAAAGGRLYLAVQSGRVICLAGKR